ncbi:putative endosomal integral membrane protein [Syncephalis plumigaleata]|nr:putative endosomal integral membrane protein [Syncephalis plumigaleata]
MLRNTTCNVLCKTDSIGKDDIYFIANRVREHYAYNWLIDGLPAAHIKVDRQTGESFYSVGFDLGQVRSDLVANNTESSIPPPVTLHNHYNIRVQYHTKDNINYRIVGVVVSPYSKNTVLKQDGTSQCNTTEPLVLDEQHGNSGIVYTYDVSWEASDIPWGTRWDSYLHVFDPSIHWFSLTISAVVVIFLTGMVAMILLKALHKDIARYNVDEEQDDIREDFGWKLVHGDVFRSPPHAMLLSVLVGNGAQLLCMAAVTLIFAVLGFLSPSNRGALITVIITFYMLFGCVAGYVSARLYKMFGGEEWKTNIALTAFLFPGIIFGIIFFINIFLLSAHSSDAVPFGTLAALFAMWFLVSTPLTFVGAYFGFKKLRIEHPVRTNQIPRQIPEQAIYLRPLPSLLMAGILPFSAIFIELYFIMNSIWYHKIYYVFGFLLLVFIIAAITCSQVAVLMCYFHLCTEEYRWWWRSFFTSGACALYTSAFAVYYYYTRLDIDSVTSTVLYFGWTGIMTLMLFVMTGAIGFAACLLFTRKIYSAIKVD